MSEYYHPAEISRLIGSAPGYVGYDQPDSWITTQIIAKPRCVLLLDEVEKAHPQVWNTFLQVFDAGLLTDGRGQRAEFRDVVIIMTTNIGAEFFGKNPFGLSPVAGDSSVESSVVTEIKSAFRPELFNRIDEVMIFQPLTAETVRLIAESQLREAAVRLRDLGYHFEVSNDLVVWLAKLGYDPVYGARPLLRVIEEKVLAPLALRAPGTFQHKIENDELTWQ
jgi:ATP-dependent Clp protease ATP-binding subunit ClpA